MKILVLNASPKGKNSCHRPHGAVSPGPAPGARRSPSSRWASASRATKRTSHPCAQSLEQADMLLFCYPVYTFIAPSQLHRLIELIKADGVDLSGKFATQITTSKHFYDVTAHRYVEENCLDLGMRVIRGLSADMEDLTTEQRQKGGARFLRPAHVLLRARALRHALPQGPGARAHGLPPDPA